jgi:hypothetical protein
VLTESQPILPALDNAGDIAATPPRAAVFVIQYRSQKRTRRYTPVDCAPFTPAQARKKAAKLLAGIRDGDGPAESRLEALVAPSVADLAERFLRNHAAKKETGAEDRRILGKYGLPVLGRHRVRAVAPRDMDLLHSTIGERAPIQANRVLAAVNTVFGLTARGNLRPEGSNPCRHVKRFRENRRERFLSAAELTRLGAALPEIEAEGRKASGSIAALRLLILTGAFSGIGLSLPMLGEPR